MIRVGQRSRKTGMGVALVALCAVAGWAAGGGQTAKAPEVSPQAAEFFEAKVRPLLVNNCFACHSDKQQMGGLRLDALAPILKGGGSGAAIVPGVPEKSLLVRAVRYEGALKMPPTGPLKPLEVAALTEWVKMGAPWPGVHVSPAAMQAAQSGEYLLTPAQKSFWSFRPIKKPPLPAVKDVAWIKSPIDRFLLAKLEARGLKPAARADRRTLLRRATFDLVGLPPTAEEVEAFLKDPSPTAFATVVDRLLADPRYGERWGRHWLDVARYADTKGYVFQEDRVYHNAYTYRDYVVRAFNDDLPYDQFVIQQLAADRLPLGEDQRPLAALGFLTVGRRFLNQEPDIIDDRIDVTCRGLMGLTVGCARCHDHKFDPIPTKDYYALYGVFASSLEPKTPLPLVPLSAAGPYTAHVAKLEAVEKQQTELVRTQVKQLRDQIKAEPARVPESAKKILQSIREKQLPNESQQTRLLPFFEPEARTLLQSLHEQMVMLKKTMPPAPDLAMALQDAPKPVEPHVFLRGNPRNLGDAVPRRFLQILSPGERKPFTQGSGRLELAQAIASPQNPLTARVLVNRLWLTHFGQGLVRTPSDFGFRGEPPTHPDLLDYLAARFVEEGWSIKKMHRLILLSNTYQMSSEDSPRAANIDPENRLLWRQNRQRLDLEALRDALIYVSGELDTKMGGPAVELTTAPYSTRRTLYGFIDRQNLQGLFRTFDFASPDSSNAQRYRTTVPQQALFMMNSPFVVERAKALTERPELVAQSDDVGRVRALYRILFARAPSAEEIALGLRFLKVGASIQTTLASAPARPAGQTQPSPPSPSPAPSASAPELDALERYAQTLLMTNEFSFVD